MFDIGWVEMMVIVIVMVIVIGPKDLPYVLRTLGRWVAQVRAVARNFQDSLEEMAEESGVNKVRDEISAASRYDPRREIEKAIDSDHAISDAMQDLTEAPRIAGDGPAKAHRPTEGEAERSEEIPDAAKAPVRDGDKT